MKAANIKVLKDELNQCTHEELLNICLRLAKFKKENKELMTYQLFESFDEQGFIQSIKEESDDLFKQINRKNYYYIKKSVRKILSNIKKHIRYSLKKETEAELMIYFLKKLKTFKPSIDRNTALQNLYSRQLNSLKKTISSLHEDLQYDYNSELNELENN